jgi:hypothetical protein
MSKSQSRSHVILAAVAALSMTSAGCSKGQSKGAEESSRAAQTSGQAVRSEEASVKVAAVDRENRTVTLEEPSGELVTVNVGDDVRLENIEPDDTVKVKYEQALAFQLQDPNAEPIEGRQAALTAERLPQGVQYGHRVSGTVEILAVDPDGTVATFRNPEGEVRTIEVEDPVNQQKVSRLRPGDDVQVTYTEKLSVQVEP